MKMSFWKRGMMLALGLLIMSTVQLRAQQGERTPEERAKHRAEHLTKTLSLNADQSKQVEALLMEEMQKMKEMRANRSAERQANRDAMRKFHEEAEERLKSILTPDQFATYQKRKEEKREKHPDGKGKRRMKE
jgi:Spy/CpxP family protein refolding chaperone